MPDAIPPRPPRRPHRLVLHGHERVDDYHWLRARDDPEVRAHLEAENAYTDAFLADLAPLREQVFREIAGRIQQTDESAPVPWGPWRYWNRTVEGLEYAMHCRAPRDAARAGEGAVVLDENALAAGHDFLALGGFEPSPDHRVLAYALDTTGGERFTVRFRDLDTGDDLGDEVPDTYYGLAWSADGSSIFYVRPDEAMRPWQVWRHTLGAAAASDVLVFEEPDERFFVHVERTRSGRYVLVDSRSKLTSEVWFVPADAPGEPLRVLAPREQGVEYHADHHPDPDRFVLLTNAGGAENFEVVEAPVASPGREHWRPLVARDPVVRIRAHAVLARHLVLAERADAEDRIRVVPLGGGGEPRLLAMPEPVRTTWLGPNEEFETATLRFGYSSLVTPLSDYDEDLDTGERVLVKRQPVLGGYDPDRFVTVREWATAPDGEQVPISIVHARGLALDGAAPALLQGYGSYEHTIDPMFRPSRLCLLERGWVFAIAHVRGGGERGRRWYEDGKLLRKRNTFTDFVACAEHLVARGYTSPERLAARGGSAGGLLMGAVANMRPDLFATIVAEVPFVDVLTTMQDPSIPLTVTEWEEWGDPSDPEAYAAMASYSPYDNVGPYDYPALLVTAGLHDPRVQYWEPAKWVAKLREVKRGDRPVLLRVEMGAGHRGPSGRYEAWREEAFILAFLLSPSGFGVNNPE